MLLANYRKVPIVQILSEFHRKVFSRKSLFTDKRIVFSVTRHKKRWNFVGTTYYYFFTNFYQFLLSLPINQLLKLFLAIHLRCYLYLSSLSPLLFPLLLTSDYLSRLFFPSSLYLDLCLRSVFFSWKTELFYTTITIFADNPPLPLTSPLILDHLRRRSFSHNHRRRSFFQTTDVAVSFRTTAVSVSSRPPLLQFQGHRRRRFFYVSVSITTSTIDLSTA